MNGENPNTVWARAFLDELARSGVQVVCVAPGSRSTPLVLAAAGDARFRTIPLVDERSAGFFALGVGKASGRPAVVITTSGTAGGNLYPAVMEASQGEVPLLILTADRPHRLRDTDGNQAVDQLRLFGSFPRAFFEVAPARVGDAELKHLRGLACRATAIAQGPPPGPVHLNFPFEKPLEPLGAPSSEAGEAETGPTRPQEGRPPGVGGSPGGSHSATGITSLALDGREGGEPWLRVARSHHRVLPDDGARLLGSISGSPRGLIVAGPVPDPLETGPALLGLAAATGFPLLADPLSGARFGPSHGAQVVAGYDLFLRSPEARARLRPDLILRVGSSPTSASLLELFTECESVPQVVLDQGHRWKDHTASAHLYLHASPTGTVSELTLEVPRVGDPRWRALWEEAERRTLEVLDAQSREEVLEPWILEAVVDVLPEGANLLVANSMPIRDLDAFGRPRPEALNVFGNRGASGIDGLVSTAAGISAVTVGPTVGVLGDLAFFHDMNGLMAAMQGDLPVGFVVVNNDGGGIFHTLPVRAFDPAFTRFFATPHGLDFRHAAELYQLSFQRTESLRGFREALLELVSSGAPFLLEVPTRREEGHARRGEILAEVRRAMEGLEGTGGL